MQNNKTSNHLLLWCPVAIKLWNMIYNFLGIQWVIGETVSQELLAWEKHKCHKFIPLFIIWVIWNGMNKRVFEDRFTDFDTINDG